MPMDLLHGLTDDQVALLGCAAALAVCGGVMAMSVLVAPRRESKTTTDRGAHAPSLSSAQEVAPSESQRRAA